VENNGEEMITILPVTAGNLIAIRISGVLVKADYMEFLTLMKQKVAEFEDVKLYMEIENFQEITLQSIWEEIKFEFKYFNNIDKLVIIGEKDWQRRAASVLAALTTGEVRYFDKTEKEYALAWIQRPSE
jgi:hypothetical protein